MYTLTRRNVLKGGSAAIATAAIAGPALALPAKDVEQLRLIADQELARTAANVRLTDRVGIADFSPYSSNPRFYVVDRVGGQISEFLVTHGRGSDPRHMGWLQHFSHIPGSNATSRGAYLTQEFYFGQHGLSMRLDGLDPDNYTARDRAIVVHGAWYAEPDMIAKYGKLGRSEGCFAFGQYELPQILNLLGPGRLLFADKLQIGGVPAVMPTDEGGDWDMGTPQDIWPSSTFDSSGNR